MSEAPSQPTINEQLNRFSDLIGKETWDPGKIEGFGPGTPPPPEFVPRPAVDLSQVPDAPDFDDEEEENIASPLIPRSEPIPQTITSGFAAFPDPKAVLEAPDLAVLGNDGMGTIGTYQGRQVQLSDVEAEAVRNIVLRAILREVQALLPKRRRRSKATKALDKVASGMAGFPIQASIPPEGGPALLVQTKRKGRPRGSKNKPKEAPST